MASIAAILLSFNILFFTVVSSTYVPCPPPPTKGHKHPPTVPTPQPPSTGTSTPPSTGTHPPSTGTTPPSTGTTPPSTGTQPPSTGTTPPSTGATPPSSGTKQPSCPTDTLKLGVCADLLGLINVQLGKSSNTPCCSLIQGLTDLDAAVCLCTALKANILGINLNIPIKLSLLLNLCGKENPNGFVCA